MYEYIKGVIEYVSDDYIVIDNNGIGYKIFTSKRVISNIIKDGNTSKVYTYLNVREDDMSLYGFLEKQELDIFKLLLSVSKIGPKVGLNIMSTITPNDLAFAITTEDSNKLSKAQGVGSKTAKRIILELKDKFNSSIISNNIEVDITINNELDEAKGALIALGYTKNEIDTVISKININECNTGEIVKKALKELAK